MHGKVGGCNNPSAPTYMGSFKIRIDFGSNGWMESARTRFSSLKHDGGLSAFNFEFTTAFTGMWSYDPNTDCGKTTIWVYDDYCG